MIRSLFLITLSLLTFSVFGQNKVFKGKTVAITEYNALNEKFAKYDIYDIDAEKMHQYFTGAAENNSITLQLGDKYNYNLDLVENHIFRKTTKVTVVTEKGEEPGELTKIKCYQGYVQGTNKSIALAVNKGLVSGLITEDDDVLYFEPVRYFIEGAPENYFIFYHAKDLLDKQERKCLAVETSDYKENINNKINKDKGKPEFAPLDCKEVDLGEASDQLMCAHYGSVSGVQDRITTVINAVQVNYYGSFNTDLTLIINEWFNVACGGTDPWTASTDPNALLNSFTSWGPGNFGSDDVGELFSYRDFDGNVIGIAWLSSVCNNGSKYNCIQDWTTNLNLQRCTVAHEIGHNFSCVHDASGAPYIMAPSVSNTNTWSPLSISAFNSFVPSRTCLSPCGGGTPPVADFTSNKVDGCKPLTVTYTDLSTNSPTSWLWTLPGGTPATSTAKNPVVVYNAVGTYSVTLKATNAAGSGTITKTNYITVRDKPVASFTYTKNEGLVTFTNTSTGGGTSYWDFGDGDFSTQDSPIHQYTDPGTYIVKLTMTNDCGSNTKTQTIVIVFIPQANFSSNVTEGCTPLTVFFQDESTYFPTSWLWTFPGGNPASSTLQNPTVVYNNAGEFDVTLKATNSAGTNTVTIMKYMKVKTLPAANFTFVVNGLSVNFTNVTTGTGNTYLWDFGDGNTSTQTSPVHVYTMEGDYSVSLTVTNICGSNSKSKSVHVLEIPTAGFSSDMTTGCTTFTVHFNDLSTHNPSSWKWIFPGGTPGVSTLQNPVIDYNSPGQYNVTLIATNAVGSDTIVKLNYINAISAPVSGFSSSTNGNVVTFTNSSTYAATYLWNFGDGNTSTQLNPVHTYAQENTYTVTLTVTNPCGSNTITHTVVIIFPPTAGFSSNVSSGCEPLTVNFTNTTSNNATYFNWTFPGGTPGTSTQQNPTIVYNTGGSYDVMLIAGNSAGTDTLLLTNYITVKTKPVTSFGFTNNNSLTFFNNTTIGGTTYVWDFGDNSTSTLKNPIHAYEAEGSYTVKLTATNDCGSTVIIQTVQVVFPPAANFSSNTNLGCNNLTITFQDLSSSSTTAWHWSFPGGNPSSSTLQNPIVNYNGAGSYDVTLIATNSGGSDTIVKPGFVLISSAPPVADFSYNSFGLSYNFFNQTPDANSFKWNFGDGGTSTDKNPHHDYTQNGSYTVQMIAFNGCGSDTFLLGVNVVGTPPSAFFGSNVTNGCLPLIVNFIDKSVGGASSWLWNFPGGDPTTSTDQNPTVVYNTAGTFPVNLIASNSFGSDTSIVLGYIVVKGVPNAQFSYTSLGNLVKFTNSSTGGTIYLWNFGDGMTSNEENPNHSYSTAGKYTVTLTVTNECGSFTFTQTVDVKVSVNEIGFIEGLNIFPNPNRGVFNISIKSKQQAEVEIKVVDMIGRELMKSVLTINEGINNNEINLNHATAGQYLVIIKSDTHLAVEKIIIE